MYQRIHRDVYEYIVIYNDITYNLDMHAHTLK